MRCPRDTRTNLHALEKCSDQNTFKFDLPILPARVATETFRALKVPFRHMQ